MLKENRERVARMENMKSVTDISRQLGAEWRALSQKEREKWEKMSQEDKQRYKRELNGPR